MQPNNTLIKVGFIAGVKFTLAFIASLLIGLALLPLAFFSTDDPIGVFVITAIIGLIIGVFFASKQLIDSGVHNAGLIAVHGAASAIVLPLFGGLVAYPALTYLLGERR